MYVVGESLVKQIIATILRRPASNIEIFVCLAIINSILVGLCVDEKSFLPRHANSTCVRSYFVNQSHV